MSKPCIVPSSNLTRLRGELQKHAEAAIRLMACDITEGSNGRGDNNRATLKSLENKIMTSCIDKKRGKEAGRVVQRGMVCMCEIYFTAKLSAPKS